MSIQWIWIVWISFFGLLILHSILVFRAYRSAWKLNMQIAEIRVLAGCHKHADFERIKSNIHSLAGCEKALTQYLHSNGTNGVDMIANERLRQINAEGWTPDHDDGHQLDELLTSADSYLMFVIDSDFDENYFDSQRAKDMWPFDWDSFKPSDDPVRNLVKAGALIAAEIDRLNRKNCKSVKAWNSGNPVSTYTLPNQEPAFEAAHPIENDTYTDQPNRELQSIQCASCGYLNGNHHSDCPVLREEKTKKLWNTSH